MEELKIELEYCYGINKLKYSFDFNEKSVYAIYAPNGVMKTSFAKAFKDLSEGIESKDLVFHERISKRIINDENNNELEKDSIFVVEPYKKEFRSDKLSTLLVNKVLREKYEEIHKGIDEKKEDLMKELKSTSGIRKGLEEIISVTFTFSEKEFYTAISRIKQEVYDSKEPVFEHIKYSKIFSEKIISFLGTKDFKSKLTEYLQIYERLLDSSTYFKKGIFNHNNASVIAKNLKDNGFFRAKHSVSLNSKDIRREITTEAELEAVIESEKESILKNPDLLKAFDEIDSKLKSNRELRDFREFLLENLDIVPELRNLDHFKQKLWISYLKKHIELYKYLVEAYESGKKEIEDIKKSALKEVTAWGNVIDIFNKRFSVPFVLSVANQEDVILEDEVPIIRFDFNDNNNSVQIAEEDLLRVLSSGEKRALYLLNIIFEVEARRKSSQETLFVIDDIADSFDYKNKYAIIEYLKDMAKENYYNQIILSHNYDFIRTICSRMDMERYNKLNTIKSKNEILLIEEKYQNNPFLHWKNNLHQNASMLIASIPFIRNLAEFAGDETNELRLTSLLHIKENSFNTTISMLQDIFNNMLSSSVNLGMWPGHKIAIELIYETANNVVAEDIDDIDLENKIVLSIAIRLKAEQFMIHNINDEKFVNDISKNQTYILYQKYCSVYPDNIDVQQILDRVNLMTPENIHLNSFMYEPILDMSYEHLRDLYFDVDKL